jgi:hypothetical protein
MWVARLILVLFIAQTSARAMDRWAALSQIESGDDDLAIGSAGEISRYQLKPKLWLQYAAPGARWESALDALEVAQKVMRDRCVDFGRTHQRQPTDFEFYVLWNAPAQVYSPSAVVRARAERFCRLIRKV